MKDTLQSWTIIIFAFNEEHSVRNVINKCLSLLNTFNPAESELIIVDDGSSDNTKIEISKCLQNEKIKLITHLKNRGIGEALLSGYREAQFENICAIPADGQFDVDELLPYKNIPAQTIISFYRTEKTRYTLFRKFLSHLNKFLNRYLLGIKLKDVNWIKVYKKDFFDTITPVLTSSLVESEICAKMMKNKFSTIEVPSKYHPRIGGKSKGASIKIIFQAAIESIKLYFIIAFFKPSKR